MRLSSAQIEVIKQVTEHFFGPQAGERQFGTTKLFGLIRQRGFTIVELIAVIIIIGIIGAIAAPRFFDNATYQNRAAADQVRAALKFGQKIAIAERRLVGVTVSSSLSTQTNCTDTVTFSGSTGLVTCAISNAVTPLSTGTYYFDSLGEPVNAGGTLINSNPAASITVGNTSDGGATITIEQETGYVH